MSDLGLHCLSVSLLLNTRHKWVKNMIAKIQTQTWITKEIRILETHLDAEEKSNAQAITQRGLTAVQQIYEKYQYCVYPI